MLFATANRVFDAFDKLSVGYDLLDKRINKLEEDHKLLGGMLDRDGSYRVMLEEIRDNYWIGRGGYSEAGVHLTFGKMTSRQASKRIVPAKKILIQLNLFLDQLDAGAAMGRAAFKERFGTK